MRVHVFLIENDQQAKEALKLDWSYAAVFEQYDRQQIVEALEALGEIQEEEI